MAHPATWIGRSRKITVSPCAPSPSRSVCAGRAARAPGRSRRCAAPARVSTRPASGCDLAGQHAQQRRLAGAVQPEQSQARAGREREAQIAEQRRARPVSFETPSTETSRFVRRSVAVKSICAVALRRCAAPGPTVRASAARPRRCAPCDLPVRALGPRRSHSTSRRTLFASDSCRFDCASRNSSFFSRKCAVAALHAEDALRIGAVDLRHVVDHVVEEVAVVAHHHAGERRRWTAASRATGCLRDRGDWWARRGTAGRAASASSRAIASRRFQPPESDPRAHRAVGEPGAPERLVDARGALQIVEVLARDRLGDHLRGASGLAEIPRPAARSRRAYCAATRRSRSRAPAGPRGSSAAWTCRSRWVRSGPAARPRKCRARCSRTAAREPKDLEIPVQLSIRAI